MRLLTLVILGVISTPFLCSAHHPDRANQHITPRVDVIGPLGNHYPASHRRQYNRPTNFGGRLAYWVAPTSQEAMTWHAATHRGDYQCDRPQAQEFYFYPKPYETLVMGARQRQSAKRSQSDLPNQESSVPDQEY